MRSFTTAGPVALSVRFAAGRISVRAAEDHGAATVDVRPNNPASSADAEHAAATVVEQRGDTIVVSAPPTKGWFGKNPKLDVEAVLPAGSRVDIDVKSADVELVGRHGRTAVTTASGDIVAEYAEELNARTASGDVSCRQVGGAAVATTASGDIRLGSVGGSAEVATASGDIDVPAAEGDVKARSASGDVVLGQIGGSVAVRTASGDTRVRSVRRGTVEINAASGDIEVGVAAGVAAWLDVQSLSGDLSSALEPTDAPGDGADTVTIHAHSLSGDVRVRRAS
jgi:DUF4097 and DUF4098 domain-containing protein YvlB